MAIQYIDQSADLVGTVAQNFNITGGSNDKLDITIDGGSVQHFTLTAGAARTAAQVVADINATITDGTAYVTPSTADLPNRVRIRTTSSLGASSTILIGAPANNANATLGFTAATYSGPVRQLVTWTATTGTKQELADKIETVLLASNWTTISGSGTTTLLMESAMTPPTSFAGGGNLKMRARIKGTNTNCVSISIEAVSGTPAGTNSTSNGAQLLPAAGKAWVFVVNQYQAIIMTNQATLGARAFAAFGIPALSPNMQGVTTQAIWLNCNTISDTDATVRPSLRTTLIGVNSSSTTNTQAIYNATLNLDLGNNSGSSAPGTTQLLPMGTGNQQAVGGVNYVDGASFLYDAWICWATSITVGPTVKGQLWDAFVVSESFTGDTTFTLPSPDGHNCIVITNANTGTVGYSPKGTLMVAVP